MFGALSLNNRLLINLGIGVGVSLVTGYCYYKFYKRNQVPQKWQRIGTLEEIYIYPVKSCGAIKLESDNEGQCDILGLHWNGILDRSFVLLDEQNGIVTGRTYPRMLPIKSEIIEPHVLRFTFDNMEPLTISLTKLTESEPLKSEIVHTNVFGSELDVVLCGTSYDQWFSQAILGKSEGLRLARYHHTKPVRPVCKDMKHEPHISGRDTGTLGDATSYMLMNSSSIDDLNKRLAKAVDPLQFRGNFYLKMDKDEPYAEDKWDWIRIGDDAVFRIVAPCTRCIMPNINPSNGQRDLEHEPLRTLKKYRKVKNYKSPPLGVHMGLRHIGVVKPNDVVYIG